MNIGIPKIDIVFKGLGSSAVARGNGGIAVLIVKDETDESFDYKMYNTIVDFNKDEQALFSDANVQYIKDCFIGGPSKIIIGRFKDDLEALLKILCAIIPNNCFVGLCASESDENNRLVQFIKTQNEKRNKRYKAVVFKTEADDMHVINFCNDKVKFADERGSVSGNLFIARLVGFFAGLPLTISSISKVFTDLDSVNEVENMEEAIAKGELVLYNDDSEVRIVRGVNSMSTVSDDMNDDMKFIIVVETMDLIYSDIYATWNKYYKGKYKNNSDNQMLLVSAIDSYFETLAEDNLLDNKYNNSVSVDILAMRRLNKLRYGEEVNKWNDEKIRSMTVGTSVLLTANIKILNAMEDFSFDITF